jgi:hypothetical protein
MIRLLCALLLVASASLSAQDTRTVIRIFDNTAKPVPYALVNLRDGVSRVADDSGRVVFNEAPKDSIRIQVRRLGYDQFFGWVTRVPETGEYPVLIRLLPQSIQSVQVTARANTPLGRSGFYDRVQRVQAGAYSARMITPEELDLRNPIKFTQMLQGENAVRIQRIDHNRMMITGRGGQCGYSILLDGNRVIGTYEELLNEKTNPPPITSLTGIDDVINMNSVAAIEVYSSAASIPAELQRSLGGGSCGLIAIWTGRRR